MVRPKAELIIKTIKLENGKEVLVVKKNLMMHMLLNEDFTAFERYEGWKYPLSIETGETGLGWGVWTEQVPGGAALYAEPLGSLQTPEPVYEGDGYEASHEFYGLLNDALKRAGIAEVADDVVGHLHYYVVAVKKDELGPSVVVTTPEVAVLRAVVETPVDAYVGTSDRGHAFISRTSIVETVAGPFRKEVVARVTAGKVLAAEVAVGRFSGEYKRREVTYLYTTVADMVAALAEHLGLVREADILLAASGLK